MLQDSEEGCTKGNWEEFMEIVSLDMVEIGSKIKKHMMPKEMRMEKHTYQTRVDFDLEIGY
jgi:hypothetical protein